MNPENFLRCIEISPSLLKELTGEIPEAILKARLIAGKWSAHEHACHIAKVQPVNSARLKKFMSEENPFFPSAAPPKDGDPNELLDMDLEKSLNEFSHGRAEFVRLARTLKGAEWEKKGTHAVFGELTPTRQMRLILLHDHVHMYRIEELYLDKIDAPPKGMQPDKIFTLLETASETLQSLIADFPPEKFKIRPPSGKWSAHEHACHFLAAQRMLNGRVERFLSEERPVFVPYLPGKSTPEDELLHMELEPSIYGFIKERERFISLLRRLKPADWSKQAEHPEYKVYTPYILARHVALHDNVHMYRIMELSAAMKKV